MPEEALDRKTARGGGGGGGGGGTGGTERDRERQTETERERQRQRETETERAHLRGKGHRQSDQHYNCSKGNSGETSERRGGAHMGFPYCVDTLSNAAGQDFSTPTP